MVNLTMNIGPTKTAWMTWGDVPDAPTVLDVPGLGVIPRVKAYKHLGVHRDEEGSTQGFRDRIRSAWGVVHKLRPFWLMPLSNATKLRIFDTFVMPVLRYGAGTWTLHTGDLAWGDKQVHAMRRVALRVPVRDTHVSSLYGDTPLLSTTQSVARVTLTGHLLRRGVHEIFGRAALWRAKENVRCARVRTLSVSELCIRDVGLDPAELEEWACTGERLPADRAKWARYADDLRQRLEPALAYVSVTSDRWASARARCHDVVDLQFVEEGAESFPREALELHCYTDGSAIGSDDMVAAGYGFAALVESSDIVTRSFPVEGGERTNNVAEILAATAAAAYAASIGARTLVLHTDSSVVWVWFHNTRRRHRLLGYRGLDNSALWCGLDDVLRRIPHTFCVKVRSHNGNALNELADRLAGDGANTASQSQFGVQGPRWTPPPVAPKAGAAVRFIARQKERVRTQEKSARALKKLELDQRVESALCAHIRNRVYEKCTLGECQHQCCNRSWVSLLRIQQPVVLPSQNVK